MNKLVETQRAKQPDQHKVAKLANQETFLTKEALEMD
jgi:hypothetical protein